MHTATPETSQEYNASVRVENEDPIALSVELTDSIREFSVNEAGAALAEALAVHERGLTTLSDAIEFAEAVRKARSHAEVVYALTFDPKEDDE